MHFHSPNSSFDNPRARFGKTPEQIRGNVFDESSPVHYASIISIKDLKYLKMQRRTFCSILIKYTSMKIWAKNVKGGSAKVEIFGNDKWDHG